MNPVFHLYQLQKIDLNLSRIATQIVKINSILENNAEILASRQVIDQQVSDQERNKQELEGIESRILEKRNKLEFAESSLYSGTIKNPKELQDLQKEINSIKPVIAGLENDQLDVLMRLEALDVKLEDLNSDHIKLLDRVKAEHQSLVKERNTLSQEISRFDSEKQVVISQIPANLQELYNSLRVKKAGIAVALVEDQTCSICGSALTPAQCQSARSQTGYLLCPSCGRILYAD